MRIGYVADPLGAWWSWINTRAGSLASASMRERSMVPHLCRMFNRAIRGQLQMPKYLSSDNDPLYRFHQWHAILRILEVTEIKSVPYVPLSHPFVERLIGTVRREYLDHVLFWTTADLENKLLDFRTYFNNHRTHDSLEGRRRIRPCLDQSKSPLRCAGQPHVEQCTNADPRFTESPQWMLVDLRTELRYARCSRSL